MSYYHSLAWKLNFSFILHASSLSCGPFIKTQLFEKSYQNAKKFKFIVNQTLGQQPRAGVNLLCILIKN
jgi:hypothetical protein